jgi:AcrR family transcriptional regulator
LNTVKIKSGKRRAKRASYHHGDLRQQLLRVAEEIILERGVDGFTLREAARRLGVSPAAPAHHFKDARGLLTVVAAAGFREFGQALEAADQTAGPDPTRRLHAQGAAYVRFALKHPAMFQLMFRHDKHDGTNPELQSAARHAYGVLEGAIRAATHTAPGQPLTPEGHGLLLAHWSIVHGVAHLALGGELCTTQGEDATEEALLGSLLPEMFKHLRMP